MGELGRKKLLSRVAKTEYGDVVAEHFARALVDASRRSVGSEEVAAHAYIAGALAREYREEPGQAGRLALDIG